MNGALNFVSLPLLVGVLAVVAVAGLCFVLFADQFASERRRNQRLSTLGAQRGWRGGAGGPATPVDAYAASMERIKKLSEADRKAKRRGLDINARLEQAGLTMKPAKFMMIFQVLGAVSALGAFLSGNDPLLAVCSGLALAFGGPRMFLGRLIKRRQRKFVDNLANAIDIMVRGVRSGLPVNESLKVIATELQDPVRTEFRRLVDTMSVGVPLEDALARMYERMPTPEVNFVRTVLVIQKQTGGNLAEALSNLSDILRARRKLKGKIQALSSEARASAMIIGALPFLVGIMVFLVAPDYLGTLFTDPMGPLLIGGGLFWMSCGVFIMRAMINFEH